MSTRILLVTALISLATASAVSQPFSYTVSARVDTTNSDVRDVLRLWLNYLGSAPDSAYDNPHWNSHEKELYGLGHYDFAGSHLFHQISAKDALASYKPTVLSVEPTGDHFEIRTLFFGENVPEEMRSSNPLTILRVAAVRQGGAWKLANILPFATRTWTEKTVGPITYVMPGGYPFDEANALRASRFIDSVANLFGVVPRPFKYYLASTIDELGSLLGHDYFFVGIATGVVIGNGQIVLAGFGSEHYPHEFVHIVLGPLANSMIAEGIATWIGGSGKLDASQWIERLQQCLSRENGVTFERILRGEWGWHCNAFYATGAVLVDLAFRQGGIEAVKRLMSAPEDDAAFEQFLAEYFGVQSVDLSAFVLRSIMIDRRSER